MKLALLDAEIVTALVNGSGTTTITFLNGAVVEVYDSETHYESYQIHIGERLIVVQPSRSALK